MVVNAKFILEAKTARQQTQLKDLEGVIDAQLENSDGHLVSVDLRDMSIGGPVLEKIQRIYRAAGWDVDYTNNQRDGEYLTFSPRKLAEPTYDCFGGGFYDR